MIGASVCILIALCAEWSSAQFLNHRPFPTYSLENMPDTGFSCRDKILGGYYADPETQCQMFHVCVKVSGVGVQDFRFLCSNGTAFDQDHQICADWQDVDCDATTLYYSSDNFDLYRIGSGFESKAVKYGEDEEPFSLQRAETGDVRINREHQSQRVNQQRENYNYKPKNQYQNRNSYNNNNNNNNNNNEKDIFKGSSSSNFFNNRNGGKETDDDDYDTANVNINQDTDQYQRRKTSGRKQNRRPNYENQTEKSRSGGLSNNFAGSSYLPTSTTARPAPTVTETVRTRPHIRVSPQYNNADNFRQTTSKNYEDDGRYRGENYGQFNRNSQTTQYTVSTPTPFRPSQYNSESSTTRFNFNPTTAPVQQSRSTENYPAPYNQPQQRYNNNQNPQTKVTENYPVTNNKKQENYQTSPVQTQVPSKETETYRNTPQTQRFKDQYETTKLKPYENYPTGYNTQTKKPTTPFKQPDNYPTTYSPKQNDYNNVPHTQQSSTVTPQTNPSYNQPTNYNKPSSQYTQSFNHHHSQYDTSRTTQNTQPTSNQPTNTQQNVKQTPVNNNPAPVQRQTPQYTQYTPTVPRITTPYYTSTTPAIPRRSNRFDETQYDDGSYNPKYDNEDDKKDDEFLKTAHSINIASSRNEYNQNNRNDYNQNHRNEYNQNSRTEYNQNNRNEYRENTKNVPVSTTQKPRPFSVTPNSFRTTEYSGTNTNTSPNTSKSTANVNKSASSPAVTNQKIATPAKKAKDVSYDYAYYDTNVGSDHDYDIAVDIEKSDKLSKKQ